MDITVNTEKSLTNKINLLKYIEEINQEVFPWQTINQPSRGQGRTRYEG
jgi:hypothetical protein